MIKSMGKADNPTPPKQTKRNQPMNAMKPITKMGNDTGRLSMVLELTCVELTLAYESSLVAATPKSSAAVYTGISAVLRY